MTISFWSVVGAWFAWNIVAPLLFFVLLILIVWMFELRNQRRTKRHLDETLSGDFKRKGGR